MTEAQPNIQGIIAIDCWQEDFLNDYYENLDRHIDFDQIQSLVVANYEVRLDTADICVYNTLETYAWHAFNPDVLLPLMLETRLRETSDWLKSKMTNSAFMLLDMPSLIHHMDTVVPHVKNWLIIGGSWQQCTHSRPICFENLQMLDKNFYIAPWSIFDATKYNVKLDEKDILQDSVHWEPIGEYFKLFGIKNL